MKPSATVIPLDPSATVPVSSRDVLQIVNMVHTYANGVRALDGVSLEVARGMFGLLGPNGAGKSTLMRIVATLQRADSGAVIVDGHDVAADPMRVRASLGYLPQDFGFHPNVPVEETLAHFATLKGYVETAERQAVVEQLLQRVNLWPERRRAAGVLSGGMRQRLGVAIALCGTPRLARRWTSRPPVSTRRSAIACTTCSPDAASTPSYSCRPTSSRTCRRFVRDGDHRRGRVVVEGSPSSLVARLHGRLWQKTVGPDEVDALRRQCNVISTRYLDGRTVTRAQRPSARRRIRAGRRGSGKRVFRDRRERHEGRSLNSATAQACVGLRGRGGCMLGRIALFELRYQLRRPSP